MNSEREYGHGDQHLDLRNPWQSLPHSLLDRGGLLLLVVVVVLIILLLALL